ncbi:hypothetical protein SAMN02745166_00044 [Prosthecobacter debontii]|uniref:Uncharacterized protein n=1 Tax=Prosthecobacter debontii TaxID=48467 RepID=A0A1T4WF67_9BACT|nr:hypothetical protein [Prosthecobacter debontii]SKA75555.1 hypothetical protein SAMN02745166_00044 [Prosthecobacter debontii]
MELQQILYLAATVVFSVACRTFDNRFLQKLGWLGYLGASYLGGYFLTGSHAAGAFGIALWFMLPWLEIVGRVRQLRFPLKSEVKHRFPPSREIFPDLDALTKETEATGFVEVGDTGWKWSETDHFMRLFYHKEMRTQASIALAQQGEFSFSYVTLTSRTQEGITLTTTNYPFAPTMQFSPQQRVNRFVYAQSMEELVASHQAFLTKRQAVGHLVDLDTEELPAYIEKDMSAQIDHNIHIGVIEPAGEGVFRYSWRGCFYLWFQVVKDMIRV